MNISAAHIAAASLAVLLLTPTVAAQSDEQAAASPTVSKVRIVRLSDVKGEVQMDRGVGRGFEPAIANLPIVENCRLQTGNDVAEVELEDNSSVRLGPDSEVEFPTLERMANGGTLSSVRVLKGMAYVSLMKTPANQFNLLFGQRNLELPPTSHIRLQLAGNEAKLAVLGGDLEIKGPDGLMDIPHKRTVTFAMTGSSEPTVAKSVESDPYDSWDKSSDEYQARAATVSAFNSAPYAYGLNDMMYYGSFADLGGCGMMWQPYFASAAWNPYSNGAWAWYGGMGYSWVSPYPWGWTPYHFGSWSFCPGAGWGWMPGAGGWMGINNAVGFAGLTGPITVPRMPVNPPRAGEPGLLMVNQKPLVRSQLNGTNSFVFRKDSAGLGVPRDALGKLKEFSERAEAKGTASTPVYLQAGTMRGTNGRESFAGVTSMRRGSAPAAIGRGDEGGEGRMGGNSGAQMSSPSMSSASAGAHASASSSGASSSRGH